MKSSLVTGTDIYTHGEEISRIGLILDRGIKNIFWNTINYLVVFKPKVKLFIWTSYLLIRRQHRVQKNLTNFRAGQTMPQIHANRRNRQWSLEIFKPKQGVKENGKYLADLYKKPVMIMKKMVYRERPGSIQRYFSVHQRRIWKWRNLGSEITLSKRFWNTVLH